MYKRFRIKHQVYDLFGATVGVNEHTSLKQTVSEAIDEANGTIAGQFPRELLDIQYRYYSLGQLVNELHEKAQDWAATSESMGAPPATAEDVVSYINDIGKEEGYPQAVIDEAAHQIEARI